MGSQEELISIRSNPARSHGCQSAVLIDMLRPYLKQGDVILASGMRSDYYFDVKSALARPEISRAIVDALAERIGEVDMLAGGGYGALGLLASLSPKLGVPYVCFRKRAQEFQYIWLGKEHDYMPMVKGKSGVIGECVPYGNAVLIDDVATTGGSLAEFAGLLRFGNMTVERAYAVVDREDGAVEKLAGIGIELDSLVSRGDFGEFNR